MKKKQILQFIIFMTLGLVMVCTLFYLFEKNENDLAARSWNGFYSEEENTIDGIIVGTSMATWAWVAPLAWHERGVRLYSLSTDEQPMAATIGVIEEARKTQNLQVIIIDVHGIRTSARLRTVNKIRNLTDSMHYSINQIRTVNRIVKYSKDYEAIYGDTIPEEKRSKLIEPSDFSNYLGFLNYHARWESGLSEADFTKESTGIKGAFTSRKKMFHAEKLEPPYIPKEANLEPLFQEVIQEVIDYGKENQLNMVFVELPSSLPEEEYIQMNAALQMAEDADFPTINFNSDTISNEISIDYATDLYNKNHVNSRGAVKITSYLTKYVCEHYGLGNEPKSKDSTSWDQSWEDYKAFFEQGWEMPIESVLSNLQK